MVFAPQALRVLYPLRVHWNAADRANLHTLGLVKMADTLCAALRINLVDFAAHVDRVIRALGLTYIAVDARISDQQGHGSLPGKGLNHRHPD